MSFSGLDLLEMTHEKLKVFSHIVNENACESLPWKLMQNEPALKYQDIINYGRKITPYPDIHNCVMCGRHDVDIPSQNKDVCKACDSQFWFNANLNVVFKFCKGCKNFYTLEDFKERPEASKCGKCRKRGRDNYISKKLESGYLSGDLMTSKCNFAGEKTPSPASRRKVKTCMESAKASVSESCHNSSACQANDANDNFNSFPGIALLRTASSSSCDSFSQRPPKIPRKVLSASLPTNQGQSPTSTEICSILNSSTPQRDSKDLPYKKRKMISFLSDQQQHISTSQSTPLLPCLMSATSLCNLVTPGPAQQFTEKPMSQEIHLSPFQLSSSPTGGSPELINKVSVVSPVLVAPSISESSTRSSSNSDWSADLQALCSKDQGVKKRKSNAVDSSNQVANDLHGAVPSRSAAQSHRRTVSFSCCTSQQNADFFPELSTPRESSDAQSALADCTSSCSSDSCNSGSGCGSVGSYSINSYEQSSSGFSGDNRSSKHFFEWDHAANSLDNLASIVLLRDTIPGQNGALQVA